MGALPPGCAAALLPGVLAAGRNAARQLPMAGLTQQDGSKDLVKLLYTSGSTGLPKGAMYTDAIWRQVSADSRKVLSNVHSVIRNILRACAGHESLCRAS